MIFDYYVDNGWPAAAAGCLALHVKNNLGNNIALHRSLYRHRAANILRRRAHTVSFYHLSMSGRSGVRATANST